MDILGTIIASYLDYDQLTTITTDPIVINPAVSKWIPADGRSIVGSDLQTRTGKTEAPDLRGKFLRGVNEIYNIGQPVLGDAFKNPENKLAGQYQEDRVGNHNHPIRTCDDGTPNMNNNFRPLAYSKHNGTTIYSEPNENDQRETRPKNISVYYYIKIND